MSSVGLVPAELQQLLRVISDIQAVNISNGESTGLYAESRPPQRADPTCLLLVAATCWLIYDIVLTFPQEVSRTRYAPSRFNFQCSLGVAHLEVCFPSR